MAEWLGKREGRRGRIGRHGVFKAPWRCGESRAAQQIWGRPGRVGGQRRPSSKSLPGTITNCSTIGK